MPSFLLTAPSCILPLPQIPLMDQVPNLKVVLEHITTADAAQWVLSSPDNVAASVTPQHMLLNRNALFAKGLRPHNYCLPVLKREKHRECGGSYGREGCGLHNYCISCLPLLNSEKHLKCSGSGEGRDEDRTSTASAACLCSSVGRTVIVVAQGKGGMRTSQALPACEMQRSCGGSGAERGSLLSVIVL